jgi:hypothetical protein
LALIKGTITCREGRQKKWKVNIRIVH